VCAVGLAFVGVVPVAAAEPDAVDVASQVVPSEVADATVDEHALDVAVRAGDIAVTVPSDAEDGIDLFLPGPDDFTIGLPFAGEAALASTDAGISFDNGNGSSTVPLVKDDGVVQLLTTIADADAPTSYSYPLDLPDGAVLTLTSDGGAEVINGNGVVIATVDAPWAVDANGNAVATHYEVSGDTLTQVVAFTTTTAFPVVADPKLTSTWWNRTVYFNRADTKKFALGTGAVGTWVSWFPGVTTTVMGRILQVNAALFGIYWGNGQCGKLVAYALGSYPVPQQYGGSEAGGYCK